MNKNAFEPAYGFVDNRSSSYKDNEVHYGLTKREYFAAIAMQGLLMQKNPHYNDRTILAENAIIYADELLKQLNP